MSDDEFDLGRAVCERRVYLRWIFTLTVVLLVLSTPYLFLTEPGSALFVISTMNVVGFGLFAIASGYGLRYCARRY